jgi:hypothetical protein
MDALGQKDQALREQLLSLRSGFPSSWLIKNLGVGRVSATKSKYHAAAVGSVFARL